MFSEKNRRGSIPRGRRLERRRGRPTPPLRRNLCRIRRVSAPCRACRRYSLQVLRRGLSYGFFQLFQEYVSLLVCRYLIGRTLGRRSPGPSIVIFYLRNAFSGRRMREYERRFFPDWLRLVARGNELRNVVTVDLYHVPIESPVFVAHRLKRHHIFRVSVYLNVIPVHYPSEISEPVFRREHRGLPCIPFFLLAVGHGAKDAERLAVHSRRVGIAGRLRKAASERARCRLESWQALALGMSLQARTEFPQRETLLNREVPGMCHRGVAHGRDVTVGEHKPVALRPIRIFRIVFQYVKIERGENVRHSKRPRRMPAFGGREHFNNSLADIVRVRFKRSHFGIR